MLITLQSLKRHGANRTRDAWSGLEPLGRDRTKHTKYHVKSYQTLDLVQVRLMSSKCECECECKCKCECKFAMRQANCNCNCNFQATGRTRRIEIQRSLKDFQENQKSETITTMMAIRMYDYDVPCTLCLIRPLQLALLSPDRLPLHHQPTTGAEMSEH